MVSFKSTEYKLMCINSTDFGYASILLSETSNSWDYPLPCGKNDLLSYEKILWYFEFYFIKDKSDMIFEKNNADTYFSGVDMVAIKIFKFLAIKYRLHKITNRSGKVHLFLDMASNYKHWFDHTLIFHVNYGMWRLEKNNSVKDLLSHGYCFIKFHKIKKIKFDVQLIKCSPVQHSKI